MEDLTNKEVVEETKEVEAVAEAKAETVEVTEVTTEVGTEIVSEEAVMAESTTEPEVTVAVAEEVAKEEQAKKSFGDVEVAAKPNVKVDVIAKYKRGEKDTGSPEVQIALLTQRISHLNEHLKAHPKDYHSRRGLLMLIGQRRRMAQYLMKTDIERYRALILELGLRK